MDTSNGKIYDEEQMKELIKKDPEAAKRLKKMVLNATAMQLKSMKIKRNDKCPCGSGLKFKKCCLRREWQIKEA